MAFATLLFEASLFRKVEPWSIKVVVATVLVGDSILPPVVVVVPPFNLYNCSSYYICSTFYCAPTFT